MIYFLKFIFVQYQSFNFFLQKIFQMSEIRKANFPYDNFNQTFKLTVTA